MTGAFVVLAYTQATRPIAMIPISYSMGWLSSVTYVSALSLWALVASHWSTWQAARVEVAQDKEIQRQKDDPMEEKVVNRMVAGD